MYHDDAYYLMPANNAKAFIPGLYTLAQDCITNGLSRADKPAVAEGTRNLVNTIKELPDDSDFRMTFSDCVLMYGILVKVKILFHTIKVKSSMEKKTQERKRFAYCFNLLMTYKSLWMRLWMTFAKLSPILNPK